MNTFDTGFENEEHVDTIEFINIVHNIMNTYFSDFEMTIENSTINNIEVHIKQFVQRVIEIYISISNDGEEVFKNMRHCIRKFVSRSIFYGFNFKNAPKFGTTAYIRTIVFPIDKFDLSTLAIACEGLTINFISELLKIAEKNKSTQIDHTHMSELRRFQNPLSDFIEYIGTY